jgi:hypothetical protein
MNERIQELLIEAHKQTNGGIYNGHLSVWTEKFAQLIVKECAGIVDNKIEVSRYVHEAELLRECSTTIKLHFGVE